MKDRLNSRPAETPGGHYTEESTGTVFRGNSWGISPITGDETEQLKRAPVRTGAEQ